METQNSKNLDQATAATTIHFFMVNKKTPSVCIEQPTPYSSAIFLPKLFVKKKEYFFSHFYIIQLFSLKECLCPWKHEKFYLQK